MILAKSCQNVQHVALNVDVDGILETGDLRIDAWGTGIMAAIPVAFWGVRFHDRSKAERPQGIDQHLDGPLLHQVLLHQSYLKTTVKFSVKTTVKLKWVS